MWWEITVSKYAFTKNTMALRETFFFRPLSLSWSEVALHMLIISTFLRAILSSIEITNQITNNILMETSPTVITEEALLHVVVAHTFYFVPRSSEVPRHFFLMDFPVCQTTLLTSALFRFCFTDVVNLNLKSTLRVLYNLFTNYKNTEWTFPVYPLKLLWILSCASADMRFTPDIKETNWDWKSLRGT